MAQALDFTYRLSQIPPDFTKDDIQRLFPEDAGDVIAVSIASAITEDVGFQVATLTFQNEPTFDKSLLQLGGECILSRLVGEGTPHPNGARIRIDNNFYGLTPVHSPNPEETVADIIAVTGLGGRGFSSWAHPGGGMWLRDYLPVDIPGIRVLIYGYHSKLEKSSSRARLMDYSIQFLQILDSARHLLKDQERPIIFIGHSLGCLIIKQALGEAAGQIRPNPYLVQSTRAIVFFGAPHRGLDTEALRIVTQGKPTEELIRELGPTSWLLVSMNDMFRAISDKVKLISCYELHETPTTVEASDGGLKRIGPPRWMVDPGSACLFWKDELIVPIHANHSLMAKLTRSSGSAYFIIRDYLKEVVENVHLNLGNVPQTSSNFRTSQIGIIGSLQAACVKSYMFLTAPDVIHKNALLLVERCRFEVWKTEFFTQLAEHSNENYLGLILRILEDKGSLMGNLPVLKEKYGFSFQLACPPSLLESQPLQPVADPVDIMWMNKSAEFLREIHESLNAAMSLNPTISDLPKYKMLVDKLRRFNDILILLLPERDMRTLEQAIITTLITNSDVSALRAVERDTRDQEDWRAIARAAGTKVWTIEIRQMSGQLALVQKPLKLPRNTLRFLGKPEDRYRIRTPAIYTPEDALPTHVLVEWKYITSTGDDFDNAPIHREIESLVSLHHETRRSKDSPFLACLGYFEEDERFGIVYQKPELADQEQDPVSLADLLGDDDNDHMPDLGDRFRLAYSLANWINEFHSIGWLHKNINPYNILFFRTRATSPGQLSGIDISSPFLAGLDFSRNVTMRTTPPTITKTYELYCHPSYLREGSFASGFRRRYDIYSLGLVLFEIGCWRKLKEFDFSEGPREGIANQIEKEYIQWIGASMGSTYRAAVLACLKGTYWPLPDDKESWDEINQFRTRVLWELGRCFV